MNTYFATLTVVLRTVGARIGPDEKGATMVEYGIMVAFIAVLVLAAVVLLGPQIAALFTSVSNAL